MLEGRTQSYFHFKPKRQVTWKTVRVKKIDSKVNINNRNSYFLQTLGK